MSGYIHTAGGDYIPNLSIGNNLKVAGNQLIVSKNSDALVHIKQKKGSKKDIIKVECPEKGEILKIDALGNVIVNGSLINNSHSKILNKQVSETNEFIIGKKWKISVNELNGNLLFYKLDNNGVWKERFQLN
jgi:hypothetical protein